MINQLLHYFSVKSQIEKSRKRLYQAAYSWSHDRALAEDLVQDAMLKALSSKSQIEDIAYLDTWLFRILINTWHDYLRSKKNIESLDDFVFTSISDVEHEYMTGEMVARVRQEIAELPVALREVITLADFSGFSYQQIAEIMQIPTGTVMSRLYRARRTLEKRLIDNSQGQPNISYLRKAP